jgi:pimeloyl-ACP methyl ester carboxylesterase
MKRQHIEYKLIESFFVMCLKVVKFIYYLILHKVYTVDLRNHADSIPYVDEMNYIAMANDLKHFIENVVLKDEKQQERQVACIGHSMGGKTFMTYALNYVN